MIDKLTKDQAVIITAFTGVLCCDWRDFHAYAERALGRPVFSHEFGTTQTMAELREMVRLDFLAMLPVETQPEQ